MRKKSRASIRPHYNRTATYTQIPLESLRIVQINSIVSVSFFFNEKGLNVQISNNTHRYRYYVVFFSFL